MAVRQIDPILLIIYHSFYLIQLLKFIQISFLGSEQDANLSYPHSTNRREHSLLNLAQLGIMHLAGIPLILEERAVGDKAAELDHVHVGAELLD
jgi:hypothetical protein